MPDDEQRGEQWRERIEGIDKEQVRLERADPSDTNTAVDAVHHASYCVRLLKAEHAATEASKIDTDAKLIVLGRKLKASREEIERLKGELAQRDDLIETVAEDARKLFDWWDDDGMTNHDRLVMCFNEAFSLADRAERAEAEREEAIEAAKTTVPGELWLAQRKAHQETLEQVKRDMARQHEEDILREHVLLRRILATSDTYNAPHETIEAIRAALAPQEES